MTPYLILVKHSVPEIEPDRPANTWRLSQEGRLRARRLAEQLKDFQPELLVSSSEPKAKETAEIIARLLQIKVETVEELHEQDRTNVPYLSAEAFQVSIREFFRKPDELVFGKETANQAHTRFYRAVHSVLNDHRNRTVAIVAHGTVIALFVARLTGVGDLSLWNELGLPSFVALDLQSNTVVIKSKIV